MENGYTVQFYGLYYLYMGERTRKTRDNFLSRLGGRFEFTPRTLAALFASGMFTGLLIRGFVPGAYGVSGSGELAQMDSGLLSSRFVSGAVMEVGADFSKVVTHHPKTWTIELTQDGHVHNIRSD